uniref:C2H2-type domain-containing protein n=1 Tax=Schistocephalus solidus TaxID=70667 RepID=A0A0X3P8I9_SCHSO
MLVEQMDSENSSQVVQVSEPWVQTQPAAENGSVLLSQVLRALTNLPENNSGAVAIANLAQPPKSKPMVVSLPNLPTSQAGSMSQTHVLIPVSALNSNRSLEAFGAATNTRPLLLQTTNVSSITTTSTPTPTPMMSGMQMPTGVPMPNGGLPQGSAVNNVLPAALVNSTTANLIAQLANSVSAGMLTVAQSSLLTHPQDVSSTLTELGQLLTTITSLTSTLHTSLGTLISMTSSDCNGGTNTPTCLSTTSTAPPPLPAAPVTTGRLITLRVIPSTTGANFVSIQPTMMKPLSNVPPENKSSEGMTDAKPSNATSEDPAAGQVQPSLAANVADSAIVSQLPETSTPLAVRPAVHARKRPAPMASEDASRHPPKSTTPELKGSTPSVPAGGLTAGASGSQVSTVDTTAASRRIDEPISGPDLDVSVPASAEDDYDDEATQPATSSSPHPTPEAHKLAAATPAVSNLARKNIYICPMEACKKSFIKRSKLRDHLCGHTGERPYVCSLCKARFIRSCDLRRHGFSHSKAENCAPDSSSLPSVL